MISDGRKTLKASELMKERRPELFSDSEELAIADLSPHSFEYHLDTLTKRKQETKFEHFARKLCEKEIAPNLLPQTGPTGGGDSKTDTETYPVSEEIAERWYVKDINASNDRWAFAISAKQDWKPKIKKDVESICSTNRGYKVIFFVSSQYIKDKDRAAVEDELSKKYNLRVSILDRSWIIDKVFSKNHIDLAVSTLDIEVSQTTTRKIGPRDQSKISAIEELEKEIADPNRYKGVEYQLADDCLRVAELSRELGKPRDDVDSKYGRAIRIARNYNLNPELLNSLYSHAWTTFWWFDDFQTLSQMYSEIETLALSSNDADVIEKASNLLSLIFSSFKKNDITAEGARFPERYERLKQSLERLENDLGRPSNALSARSLHVFWKFLVAEIDIPTLHDEVSAILDAGEHLLDFSILSFLAIIKEMEQFLEQDSRFDELFEKVLHLTSKRKSEGAAGNLIIQRAVRLINNEQFYEAIKYFGKAQTYFAKNEYFNELIFSLVGGALAYEDQGMLWAARANLLAALSRSLTKFWKEKEISPHTLRHISRLINVELKLGRTAHVLAWCELYDVIADYVVKSETERKEYLNQSNRLDIVFSLLILKTDFSNLDCLSSLLKSLNRLKLYVSEYAALFSLGYVEKLNEKGELFEGKSEDDIKSFYWNSLNQPGMDSFINRLDFETGQRVLATVILGVRISVEIEDTLKSNLFGEMFISILESLWATSLAQGVLPHRSSYTIKIKELENAPEHVQWSEQWVNGENILVVELSSFDFNQLHGQERQVLKDKVLKLAIQTFCSVAISDNMEEFAKKIFGDELAISRAVMFADVDVFFRNIFGDFGRAKLEHWQSDERDSLKNNRSTVWSEGLSISTVHNDGSDIKPNSEISEKKIEEVGHNERKVSSLIDLNLWNQAGWTAAMYVSDPAIPPAMILGYKNIEVGKKIFEGLRFKLRQSNSSEILRVSIVRGVDKTKPYSYRVIIGTNPTATAGNKTEYHVFISRILQVDPTSNANLDGFLSLLKKYGFFIFAPGDFKNREVNFHDLNELGIQVMHSQLVVKNAWEVSANDPELSCLDLEDDPIVPPYVSDPPFRKALEQLRNFRTLRE